MSIPSSGSPDVPKANYFEPTEKSTFFRTARGKINLLGFSKENSVAVRNFVTHHAKPAQDVGLFEKFLRMIGKGRIVVIKTQDAKGNERIVRASYNQLCKALNLNKEDQADLQQKMSGNVDAT